MVNKTWSESSALWLWMMGDFNLHLFPNMWIPRLDMFLLFLLSIIVSDWVFSFSTVFGNLQRCLPGSTFHLILRITVFIPLVNYRTILDWAVEPHLEYPLV